MWILAPKLPLPTCLVWCGTQDRPVEGNDPMAQLVSNIDGPLF
jgi:hypothetical protein